MMMRLHAAIFISVNDCVIKQFSPGTKMFCGFS